MCRLLILQSNQPVSKREVKNFKIQMETKDTYDLSERFDDFLHLCLLGGKIFKTDKKYKRWIAENNFNDVPNTKDEYYTILKALESTKP
jgi:hypothetical protein